MIFTPCNIGSAQIKNRFIRSATVDFPAQPDGCCSDSYIQYLEELAEGGVGLICTAPVAIQPNFRANRYQLSISNQKAANSFKHLIDRIHTHGTKLFLYPDYSNDVIVKFLLSMVRQDSSDRAEAFKDLQTWITSVLKVNEITGIIDLYKMAITRAQQTGFDGVFLNATLGAPLQTVSSPRFNHRHDEWGGNLTKRLRILREILHVCKTLDFPVMVRWDVKDYEANGITVDESIEACQLLQDWGADALELAAFSSVESTIALNKDIEQRKSLPLAETNDFLDYYRIMHPFARNEFFLKRQKDIKLPVEYVWGHAHYNIQPVKKCLKIPVSLLGGVRSLETADRIINTGMSDFISLVRTLIYDPSQCHSFEEGASTYSSCISCNCCMNQMFPSLENPSRSYLHRCVIRSR